MIDVDRTVIVPVSAGSALQAAFLHQMSVEHRTPASGRLAPGAAGVAVDRLLDSMAFQDQQTVNPVTFVVNVQRVDAAP